MVPVPGSGNNKHKTNKITDKSKFILILDTWLIIQCKNAEQLHLNSDPTLFKRQ